MFKDLAVCFLLHGSRKIEVLIHPDKQEHGKGKQSRSCQDQRSSVLPEKVIEQIACGVTKTADHQSGTCKAGQFLTVRKVGEQKDSVYREEPEGQVIDVPENDMRDRFTGKSQHDKRRHQSGKRTDGAILAASVIDITCADQTGGVDQAGQLDADTGMDVRRRKTKTEVLDQAYQEKGKTDHEHSLPVKPGVSLSAAGRNVPFVRFPCFYRTCDIIISRDNRLINLFESRLTAFISLILLPGKVAKPCAQSGGGSIEKQRPGRPEKTAPADEGDHPGHQGRDGISIAIDPAPAGNTCG